MPATRNSTGTLSSRTRTQVSGRFIRETPGSQSLERGLKLLRAFRVGNPLLTNAELAERAGLARPTVSRLARSLVDAGFLSYDVGQRAYRLGAVMLSLAQVYQSDAGPLNEALPLMEAMAFAERVNVGMAVGDLTEMVYLASARWSRRGLARHLAPGSRVPMDCTALGHAWLAGTDTAHRQELMERFSQKLGNAWPAARLAIRLGLEKIDADGWCMAMWQPGMMALATPVQGPDRSTYALNLSFPFATQDDEKLIDGHAQRLMSLRSRIAQAWGVI